MALSIYDSITVDLSEDQSIAYMTMKRRDGVPPDMKLDATELLKELDTKHKLPPASVNADLVRQIIEKYNTDSEEFERVEIANTGQPMIKGTDARLEWLIDREATPTEDEKGRVDFYAMSALSNCEPGQPIARLYPAVPGTPGKSVKGETIEPPPVATASYQPGENTEFNPETGEFIAKLAGRVELRASTILVSRLFEVTADVDFSVGNINFDGFVRVRGNVNDNFKVTAKDGVQVDGVVEAAQIDSGGTVTVKGGVNCRGKGRIDGGADLLTRFLNNAEVYCKGMVKVEREIVNCKVFAGSIQAPQGQVAGGEVSAATTVEVKEAGSQMGVRTVLTAGYDYFAEQQLKREIEELGKLKASVKDAEVKLDAIKGLTRKAAPEHQAAAQALGKKVEEARARVTKSEEEIDAKKKKQPGPEAQVIVRSVLNPGVVIRIGRYEKSIGQKFEGYRRYVFDKNKYDIVPFFEKE